MKVMHYAVFSMLMVTILCLVNVNTILPQVQNPLTNKREKSKLQRDDSKPYANPKTPIGCEEALLYFEDAISRARKTNSLSLIFINRSGTGESNKTATLRLRQVKAYASRFGINTVFAIGENSKGFGIWEIYLEGRPLYSLPLFKNRGFNLVGGCIE